MPGFPLVGLRSKTSLAESETTFRERGESPHDELHRRYDSVVSTADGILRLLQKLLGDQPSRHDFVSRRITELSENWTLLDPGEPFQKASETAI